VFVQSRIKRLEPEEWESRYSQLDSQRNALETTADVVHEVHAVVCEYDRGIALPAALEKEVER
jgi:hypothetical protein